MQDHGRTSNLNNLKLRNTYKRYFIWGSKEKPGFKISKPRKPLKHSKSFKLNLEKASNKRILKIFTIVFILFVFYIIINYFIVKM